MHIGIHSLAWARHAGVHVRRSIAKHPRTYSWALLLVLGIAIVVLSVQTALAAVQLNFFNVISNPASVTLEWSTASEVNVAGFDIQCKLAAEPETSFHEIGYQQARGGPGVGALYTFPVTSGVVPGTAYCFRLKEVTTDGSPGEVFDRCGYGPNVTPTPGAPGAIPTFAPQAIPTDQFGNPIVPTLAIPAAVPTDAFGNPIPPTPAVPQAVPTDAFGNPILPTPAVPQAVPTDAFGSPLPTPIPPAAVPTQAVPQVVPTDAFGNPIPPTPSLPQAVPTDAFGNPIPPTPAVPQAAVADPLFSPLAPPVQPSVGTDAFGNPVAPARPDDAATAALAAQQYAPVATPTVSYVVVTATPTQAPVALAPVLTPLPTTTPAPPGIQLASVLEPTSQNLMVMLLCLTFSGASAIGLVGLITSVMYMRARSSQRDFYDRSGRRRL